ncbi:hypothetical protein DJ568_06420 [Mucilaginibacter hurinus]|uniref:CHRD domain-containing protein n=1 Tax=Mucilaginibacter hurinus TaxID=2201324 RepID=A0A367GS31_9SPHI|nr:hypothetical protein [Mucilaginibacter hurinus]RCH55523.1 hypothetical protein DJ568_06420 [Mucilaginibacter hurinus]
MKTFNKLKAILLIVLIVAVSATSCKKDKDTKTSNGQFATVTAKRFAFGSGAVAEFKSTAAVVAKAGPIFTMTAVRDGLKESITIALYGATGTGTYSLNKDNSTGNGAVMYKDFQNTTNKKLIYTTGEKNSGGGQVKITKLTDTEIEGTFFIVAHNEDGEEAFVEQGEFSGKITTVK